MRSYLRCSKSIVRPQDVFNSQLKCRPSICASYYYLHYYYVKTSSVSEESRLKQSKFSVKSLKYKCKYWETYSKDWFKV